jgi:Peptidase family M1 domain
MKYALVVLCLFILNWSKAQKTYFQQKVVYNINVELDDKAKILKGNEALVYTNNSPETLEFIWFHIYPNAYKNKTTAMFKQIENDPSRSEKLKKITFGSISGLQFKVNGQVAKTEAHSNKQYIDIIKVLLPKPLAPGASVNISTPFLVKLPNYFSRSGFADGEFMATQWYPKPAVYDVNGWNEFPYLDMGEFYNDYGSYKVNITLPSDYVVGATGVLETAAELEQYKKTGAINNQKREGKFVPYKAVKPNTKKTLSYYATDVADFAFFADKKFVVQYDTIQLPSGKVVDAFNYFYPKENTVWKNSIDYTKDAIRKYSGYVGEYAYPTAQVVEGPKNNASGGMEYPMVTLITSPNAEYQALDAVIAHEVGHNWFMSMLGSNERVHGFLDEGFNTYFQFRYEAEKYRANSILGPTPDEYKKGTADEFIKVVYDALKQLPTSFPIDTHSAEFSNSQDYGITIYIKTAQWLYILEEQLGKKVIDAAFADYFANWKFKHPQPADFKASLEKVAGKKLDAEFELLKKKENL